MMLPTVRGEEWIAGTRPAMTTWVWRAPLRARELTPIACPDCGTADLRALCIHLIETGAGLEPSGFAIEGL